MTSTALEQAQASDLQARQALNRDIAVARQLNASSLLRKDLQGERNLPDAQAIAITLHQYGIPVGIQNMNACFVVNGRVDFMTRIWTALAHRGGYRVWPDDASDGETGIAHILNTATGEEHTVTFTWEDAQKASLTGSDTYKRYGRDMLIWRAMARAVRWHAPEVVAGMAEVDNAPVTRPRPRTIPAAAYPVEMDDDITDAEIVEQGEDVVIPGHATVAPPGPAPDPEKWAAFVRWTEAGEPRDENGYPVAVPTEEPEGGRDNGGEQVVGASTAPAPPGPVPGEWRARAVEQGKGDALLIKKAREFASERGVELAALPRTLDQVTDPADIARLEEWIG